MNYKTLICLMLSMVSSALKAATLRVPQDYSTISGAVSAAHAGDEIVVSPGTYVINSGIQPSVAYLTIRSTFDGTNWDTVKNTIIKATSNAPFIIGLSSALPGVTIRGFTLTRDPVTIGPDTSIFARGIASDGTIANVEYNIIENCVCHRGQFDAQGSDSGAAIVSINGVIQGNIIRNCMARGGAALYDCNGTVRNNVIYSCPMSVSTCRAAFVNNTIYDTTGIYIIPVGSCANNILWNPNGAFTYAGPDPSHCDISGYSGPGTGNMSADPKFADPAHGDFHLKPGSPCIDAGTSTTQTPVKADLEGVQRNLAGTTQTQPRTGPAAPGTAIDIGAYEYKPKPVAVWLPFGGPDVIHAGDTVTVAWELDTATAGTAVDLQLWDDRRFVADFGSFFHRPGRAKAK